MGHHKEKSGKDSSRRRENKYALEDEAGNQVAEYSHNTELATYDARDPYGYEDASYYDYDADPVDASLSGDPFTAQHYQPFGDDEEHSVSESVPRSTELVYLDEYGDHQSDYSQVSGERSETEVTGEGGDEYTYEPHYASTTQIAHYSHEVEDPGPTDDLTERLQDYLANRFSQENRKKRNLKDKAALPVWLPYRTGSGGEQSHDRYTCELRQQDCTKWKKTISKVDTGNETGHHFVSDRLIRKLGYGKGDYDTTKRDIVRTMGGPVRTKGSILLWCMIEFYPGEGTHDQHVRFEIYDNSNVRDYDVIFNVMPPPPAGSWGSLGMTAWGTHPQTPQERAEMERLEEERQRRAAEEAAILAARKAKRAKAKAKDRDKR